MEAIGRTREARYRNTPIKIRKIKGRTAVRHHLQTQKLAEIYTEFMRQAAREFNAKIMAAGAWSALTHLIRGGRPNDQRIETSRELSTRGKVEGLLKAKYFRRAAPLSAASRRSLRKGRFPSSPPRHEFVG